MPVDSLLAFMRYHDCVNESLTADSHLQLIESRWGNYRKKHSCFGHVVDVAEMLSHRFKTCIEYPVLRPGGGSRVFIAV